MFEYPFEIRQRDVDQFDRITPGALYGSMQDAAIAHSAARGLSGAKFLEMGYAWMLNRVHIVIDTPPILLDRLTINTWGSTLSGLYAIREFRVLAETNEILARGTSRWVVIHVKKKRVVRLPDFIEDRYGTKPERGLENSFGKLRLDIEPDHTVDLQVRWSDLDSNRHANSARYFDWCVDAIPQDLLERTRLAEIELEYKKELRLGDVPNSGCQLQNREAHDGQHVAHCISTDNARTLIAQARSRWI